MLIRDRIKELRRVPASELLPNPRNWRTHPEAQRRALEGLFAEVGYADALVARELPDGSLELIDGHLRAETAPDALAPVLVLDVNEVEADKLLLTLDPLAAMAETNVVQLDRLLRRVNTGAADVQEMVAELADKAGLYRVEERRELESELRASYQVVVECATENDQRGLFERMREEGFLCRVLTL